MPLLYIITHILASLLCLYSIWAVRKRPVLLNTVGITTLLLVVLGLAAERRTDWAWTLMRYFGSDLVFWTNMTLEGASVLCALLWISAAGRREQFRAGLLCIPLLVVALWSYAWYFEPLPSGLQGKANTSGICLQSTEDSCSAAAAVMLLHQHGIAATEAEMAALCLTRAGKGTCALGLYHGLAQKARLKGLRPQILSLARPEAFRSLDNPAIINVGLRADTPPQLMSKMQEYGWNVGSRHTVVVLRMDTAGKWIEVVDPSNGKERWPAEELGYLWDGNALMLATEDYKETF